MAYVVQVQHSSDHELDGKWFDLEIVGSEAAAIDKMLWFKGWRQKRGTYRQSGMGYAGRPMRYIVA